MKYSFPFSESILLITVIIPVIAIIIGCIIFAFKCLDNSKSVDESVDESNNELKDVKKLKKSDLLLTPDKAKIIIKIYDILSNKTDWRLTSYDVRRGYNLGQYQYDYFIFHRHNNSYLFITVIEHFGGRYVNVKMDQPYLDVNIIDKGLADRLVSYGKDYTQTTYNKAIDSI